jgi:hypothetical protein
MNRRVTISRGLYEYAAQPGARRVDRERGIVYGCKVVGRCSGNTHNVEGVSGTDYAASALREALPLYEGAPCFCDHPPRDPRTGRPLKQDRPADSRLGTLRNVRMRDREVYGDLHLLLSHPRAERVMEAAEREDMSDAYALSHNSYGRGEVRNGRYVITSIPTVHSVDLVSQGGTNKGLFESSTRRTPMIQPTRTGQSMAARIKALDNKDAARSLCESLAFRPSPVQLQALAALDSPADRLARARELMGQGVQAVRRPAASGLQESAVPKDPAKQLRWLRDGCEAPTPQNLRHTPVPRTPAVSRALREGRVPENPAAQLAWLLS